MKKFLKMLVVLVFVGLSSGCITVYQDGIERAGYGNDRYQGPSTYYNKQIHAHNGRVVHKSETTITTQGDYGYYNHNHRSGSGGGWHGGYNGPSQVQVPAAPSACELEAMLPQQRR